MHQQLHHLISGARWFGGKGRDFTVSDVRLLALPPVLPVPEGPEPDVRIALVTLTYADGDGAAGADGDGDAGGDTETYQVPLSYYAEQVDHMEHALVGRWTDEELGDRWVYDALHDHHATPEWLRRFAASSTGDDLAFHHLEGHELDLDARSALFSGEQSNSSVFFGEDCLMKVFRKVTPGGNPDIEIHEALTRAGSEHVAALYGWLEAPAHDGLPPFQLAMLQQFLRTASDGWELALASVRDLLADLDVAPAETGGDFAAESHRLGVATAEVHAVLAESFPTATWGEAELGALADAMESRLDRASGIVPELVPHAAALRRTFEGVRAISEPVTVQRVHGDFHLGQTLRTVRGWKIVDFEGEPAKPLEERVRADSPWRDVAGMLRSFDYAAHAMQTDVEAPAEDDQARLAARAREWADRNRTAFLDGYTEVRHGEVDARLLHAYEADKAVYEAVYETRNRPAWAPIPLGAIRRLAG